MEEKPAEWPSARRVTVTSHGENGSPAGTWHGWELLEDIEGYASAGQLWLDGQDVGQDESVSPAGNWIIEAE